MLIIFWTQVLGELVLFLISSKDKMAVGCGQAILSQTIKKENNQYLFPFYELNQTIFSWYCDFLLVKLCLNFIQW